MKLLELQKELIDLLNFTEFIKNDPTLFTDEKIEIKGDKGEMILFDSGLEHCVKKQKLDYERITFAFNIRRKDYHARS